MSEPLFVDRHAAARLTALSYSLLAHRARSLDGPPHLRIGRRIVYYVHDLLIWMNAHACRPHRPRGRPRKTYSKANSRPTGGAK